MISALARFANDCYHIFKSPSGSRAAILKGLVFPGAHKMGFQVAHFDRLTLNYLYREIFVRQSYFFRSENVAPVILDCGANIGMASLYFKWLYPHSQVQAFEPDPATFKVLQSNIAVNHLDIVSHHCALFESNTEIDLFVDRASPGGLLMSTDIPRPSTQPVKVPARRLSDFITGSVDFLKLDVEGAEHHVLSDLVQTGKLKNIRQMVVEYHHKMNQKSRLAEFLAHLEQAGFEYQVNAGVYPVSTRNVPQAMLIGAYQ